MNYRIYEVEEGEKEALAELRIAAMRPSLEAVGRFDPDRACINGSIAAVNARVTLGVD